MYDITNPSLVQIGTSNQYDLNFDISVEPHENVVFASRAIGSINFDVVSSSQPDPEIHVHHVVDKHPNEGELVVRIMKDGEEVSNTTVHMNKSLGLLLVFLLLFQSLFAGLSEVDRYMKSGELDSAAAECLRIIEEEEDPGSKGLASKKLGIIYAMSGSHELALERFKESAAYFELANNQLELARAYTNIGNSYYQMGQCGRSLEYYQLRYSLSIAQADSLGMISALLNMGACKHQLGRYESALEDLLPALDLAGQVGDEERIIRCTDNIVACYNEMGQFQKSLAIILENNQSGRVSDAELMKSVYYNTAQTFKHLGATDSAFFYFSLFVKMQDSLHQIEEFKAIQEVQTKYEVEAHEAENKMLWLLLLAAIQILIVLGLVLGFTFKNNKLKRKYERRLSKEVLTYHENFRKSLGVELDEVVHEYFGHVFGGELSPEQEKTFKLFFEDIDYLSQKTYNLKIGTPHWMEALNDLALTKQLKVDLKSSDLLPDIPEFLQIAIYRITEELIRNCKQVGATHQTITYGTTDDFIEIRSTCNSKEFTTSKLLYTLVHYFQGEETNIQEGGEDLLLIQIPKK